MFILGLPASVVVRLASHHHCLSGSVSYILRESDVWGQLLENNEMRGSPNISNTNTNSKQVLAEMNYRRAKERILFGQSGARLCVSGTWEAGRGSLR